jgi:hypothetical protein
MTISTFKKIASLTWSAYGFAAVMAFLAIIPGCNLAYSGHGGPAWLILPFVFPVALLRLYLHYRLAPKEQKAFAKRFGFASVGAYMPLSLGAAFLGAFSIGKTIGLPVEPLPLWGMFTLPFGLIFSWRFFVL